MTRTWTLLCVLSVVLAGCGGEDTVGGEIEPAGSPDPIRSAATAEVATASDVAEPVPDVQPSPTATATEPARQTLVLTGEGLPPGEYTVVVGTTGDPLVSTQSLDDGTFTIDLAGTAAEDVETVSVHAGSTAAGPALLSGSVQDGAGTLTSSLPVDLSGASGQYILATPTNGGDSDERSGIWYVLIPRAPGLVLPALPAEWRYEGWVTIDGVDVSTGRFSDPAVADDFDGFSGDQGGPPLPGEDFLTNAPSGTTFPVDLAGLTTFVTIEPADDPSPTPSGLTVLSGQIPPDAADHTIYDLTSTVAALPTLAVAIS